MKYRTSRGGGLKVVEEQPAEEDTKSSIVERFKPLADAITDKWVPFPDITPGVTPTGPWVLVQKRASRKKIGSIHTAGETQEVDGWRERIGKLIAIGSGAYKDVDGHDAFGVGDGWPKVNDLVLIPSSGGTEFNRIAADGSKVVVTMFHWRDLMGIVQDVSL
jgi:hypothetical protein